MATFKIYIPRSNQRRDGRYPISIRVTSNRTHAYLNTGLYAVDGQLDKSKKNLKDKELDRSIDRHLVKIERMVANQLGADVTTYSARDLVDWINRKANEPSQIDFIDFATTLIDNRKKSDRTTTYAKTLEAAVRALVDFFGRDVVYVSEITSKSLSAFAEYLQSDRKIVRIGRGGKEVVTNHKGVSDRTMAGYMSHIRTIFNAALDKYNDEEMGVSVITHYPFRKFKIKANFKSENRNLSIEDVRKIRDFTVGDIKESRAELARDVFMISFYMLGANLTDLYQIADFKDGRLSYNRSKTRDRREDEAFISIEVQPELLSLIEKYRDRTGARVFDFYRRYSDNKYFTKAVNVGLKQIAAAVGIERNLSSYYVRHSWATIAINDAKVDKYVVHTALNHVDDKMKVTDIYIKKDWSAIDEANRKVIDLLNNCCSEKEE